MREAGEVKVSLLYPAKTVTTPGSVVSPIFPSFTEREARRAGRKETIA